MTFATTLTLLRLVLIIPITVLALAQDTSIAAFVLFLIAASTDYFDGFVARRFNQVTPFGARLDASVDKIFVYVLIGALMFSGSYLPFLVAASFARDLAVEFFRQQAAAKSRVIPANRWGKVKFLLQCLSIGIALIAHSLPSAVTWYGIANVVLAIAVVAGIPGAFVVWHTSQEEVSAA